MLTTAILTQKNCQYDLEIAEEFLKRTKKLLLKEEVSYLKNGKNKGVKARKFLIQGKPYC